MGRVGHQHRDNHQLLVAAVGNLVDHISNTRHLIQQSQVYVNTHTRHLDLQAIDMSTNRIIVRTVISALVVIAVYTRVKGFPGEEIRHIPIRNDGSLVQDTVLIKISEDIAEGGGDVLISRCPLRMLVGFWNTQVYAMRTKGCAVGIHDGNVTVLDYRRFAMPNEHQGNPAGVSSGWSKVRLSRINAAGVTIPVVHLNSGIKRGICVIIIASCERRTYQ